MSASEGMDPVFLALSRMRRRRFQECADICTEILAENPRDLVRQNIIDMDNLNRGSL